MAKKTADQQAEQAARDQAVRSLEMEPAKPVPRAEWDQVADHDMRGRMAFPLWNYRLQRAEWSFTPLQVAVTLGDLTPEGRRDYLPPEWVESKPDPEWVKAVRRLRMRRDSEGSHAAELAGSLDRD